MKQKLTTAPVPLEQSGCEEQTTQQDDDAYQESEVSEKTGDPGADGTDRPVCHEGLEDNISKFSRASNPRQRRNPTAGWKPTNWRKSDKLTKGTRTSRWSLDKESDKDGVFKPDGGTVLGPRQNEVQKLKKSDVVQHKDTAEGG